MTRRSNRREFIQGRAATDAVGDLAAGSQVDESADGSAPVNWVEAASAPYQMRMQRPAMACTFEVFFNAGQHADATETALAAFDLIDELEAQLTVYRDTSEVMRLNRAAAEGPVVVEPRLFALLARAVEIHRETNGAFDITAGPLTKVWGFHRRAGQVPTDADLAEALLCVGSQHLELDADSCAVRFRTPGIEINLGAIGKGYSLDRSAILMAAAGVNDFLWHGGQSSVLARGGSTAGIGGGWTVGVRDPIQADRRLAEITLRDRALATSGASVQFFRHQGKRYGHILDPRTGWPAEGVFSATVVAPTAAEADALSTACYVLGVDGALDLARRRGDIGVVMVYPSAGGSSVEMSVEGLAGEDLRIQ